MEGRGANSQLRNLPGSLQSRTQRSPALGLVQLLPAGAAPGSLPLTTSVRLLLPAWLPAARSLEAEREPGRVLRLCVSMDGPVDQGYGPGCHLGLPRLFREHLSGHTKHLLGCLLALGELLISYVVSSYEENGSEDQPHWGHIVCTAEATIYKAPRTLSAFWKISCSMALQTTLLTVNSYSGKYRELTAGVTGLP